MMIRSIISVLPSVGSAAMWYLIVFVIRYHLLFCDLSRPNVSWHMHTQPRSNCTSGAKGMVYHREGMHSGIESGIHYIQAGNRGRGTFAYILVSSWTPSMPHMNPTEPDVIDCAITSPSIM